MVADALDHGDGARIAHGETFPRNAGQEGLAFGGAVETGIADDDVGRSLARRLFRLADDHAAAGQALADIIIGVADQLQRHAAREEGAEALPGRTGQPRLQTAVRQPGMAVPPRDFPRRHRPGRAVGIGDRALDPGRQRAIQRLDQLTVDRRTGGAAERRNMAARAIRLRHMKQPGKIDPLTFPVPPDSRGIEQVGAADQLLQPAQAEPGEDFAHLLGDEEEVIDHMLALAGEAGAEHRILRRDADRAGVEMAFAHHHAAGGDQGRGGEAELVRAQSRRNRHVAAGTEAAIGLHDDPLAQAIEHQGLLGLGEADLPGQAGMGQRGEWARAGAALIAGDGDMVGHAFGDPGRDRADALLADQLHRDARRRVHAAQIVDQLGEILDRIDVVMRRRADQADAGGGVANGGDLGIHLVAGQLAALAGLRALRDLDLQIVGVDQIFGGDAEAAGSDLLDRRTGVGHEPLRLLAALAGVGLAADPVHRLGERGMRLPADRAEAHGAGGEALHNFGGRLDLVERHRRTGGAEIEQAPEREQPPALRVQLVREGAIFVGQVAARRMLEVGDAVEGPGMGLAASALAIEAADIERLRLRGVRRTVTAGGFLRQLGEADAANRRRGAGEIFVDQTLGQADRVENLRAAIGLEGGDAHLGHYLQDTLADRLDVIGLRGFGRQSELPAHGQILDQVEGEPGIDRLRAIAGEHAEMVDLTRLAGLQHEAGLHAQALADEMMMDRAGGERSRNGDAVGALRPVRQDQQVDVGEDRLRRLPAKPLQRRLKRLRVAALRPGRIERDRAEGAVERLVNGPNFLQILIGEDRLRDFEPLMVAGIVAEQVRPRPDHRDEAHHQALADRIDRRVGDLGEVLLEIIVEQTRPLGEQGERRVRAHRADRIVGIGRHRAEEVFQVLVRVTEADLGAAENVVVRRPAERIAAGREVGEIELGLRQPFAIRLGLGERGLHLFVLDDPAFLQVDEQHLARLQPPFARDLLLGDRQHSAFRGHDDQIVVGDAEAGGPQAVAVERRADLPAIGEGDGGGAVPGFHQGGMIFVEGAPFRLHPRVGPGLWDEQHHRMRQRVTAGQQQLERVVEAGRVGLAVRDNRPHLVEIGAEQWRFQRPPACVHPVHVAAQRVDFAIMGNEPIGMRKPPAREGVGRETLMDHGQRRDGQRIPEVAVEVADLMREQHALVDQGPAGEGGDVEIGQARKAAPFRLHVQRVQHLLADRQQLTLERVLISRIGAARDHRLRNPRHRRLRRDAEQSRIDRHLAPADQLLPFHPHEPFEALDRSGAAGLVARQEAHRHRIIAGRRQAQLLRIRPGPEQGIRDLDQAAGAVAKRRVRTHAAAMIEIGEDVETVRDDRVGALTLHMRDEAHAAGIPLESGIIKTLLRRCSHHALRSSQPCCDAARVTDSPFAHKGRARA